MKFLLGKRYVNVDVVRKVLGELDMNTQESVIRRLHRDGMRKDHLSLLFGREVEVIDEIIENAPKSTRALKVDEEGLNKYDLFIQEKWPVEISDLVEEFQVSRGYASLKIREYEEKTQRMAAYGGVKVNGELLENVLVIQFPSAEQLEQALEEGNVRFS